MPARDQHDVIILTEIKRPPDIVKIHHDGCVRLGKTFCIGKGRPVINHFCFKAGELRSPYQEKGDVATPKDIDSRGRQYGLQKDLQLGTVRRLVDLNRKLFALQDLLPAMLRERFERNITQQAYHRAIVTH